MKRIDRYIMRTWTRWFALSTVVLVVMYLSGDAAFLLWDLLQRGLPAVSILLHFILKIPTIFYQMSPVAALLATLLTLTGLKRHGEMAAILGSGMSGMRLARSVLVCALLVSAFSYYVNETLAPPANRLSRDIIRGDGLSSRRVVGTDRVWLLEGRRVIFISSVEEEGRLLTQPTVLEFTGGKFDSLDRRIDAVSARWTDGAWMAEGAVARRFVNGSVTSAEATPSMTLPISIKPEEFFHIRRTPEEMNRSDLLRYIENLRKAGLPYARYAVRVYRNTAAALLPLVFTLLGVPISFLVPLRGGAAAGIGISIVLAVVFWSTFSFFQSLGYSGVLPPAAAAWTANVLFMAAGLVAIAGVRRVRLT